MKIGKHCVIQISMRADEVICKAAEQLQTYIQKIFSVYLQIKTDNNFYEQYIAVGQTKYNLVSFKEIDQLENDGCIYKVEKQCAQIVGKTSYGVLNGVFTFLEEVLGCRYFAKNDFYIPKKLDCELPECHHSYSPAFMQRAIYDGGCNDSNYAMANRLNDQQYDLKDSEGAKSFFIAHFCHTLPKYISQEEYYEEHPEYFALVGGVRLKKSQAQLCYSNPDIVDIAVQKILSEKRENPNIKMFSLSQGDGYFFCECDTCKAAYKKYNAKSGPQIQFVNEVAKKVAIEYPELIIDTLAYLHSRRPPKNIQIVKNVQVRLCSIECNQLQPLGESNAIEERCYENGKSYPPEEYLSDLSGWKELTERVFVWDYPINVRSIFIPYPNFKVLEKNIKTHQKYGVKGVFLNGVKSSQYGSLSDWRNYLCAKLLWNPDCNIKEHSREFLEFYYGAASKKMEELLRFLEDRYNKKPIYMHCQYPLGRYPEFEDYYRGDFVQEYERLLKESMALVIDDEKRYARIEREMLSVYLIRLIYMSATDKEFEPLLEKYLSESRRLEVGELSECKSSEENVRYLLRSKDFLFEKYGQKDEKWL